MIICGLQSFKTRIFLESYDLSGKTVIPFATSGGSGMSKTEEILQKICPANWKNGRVINRASDNDLSKWVDELNV